MSGDDEGAAPPDWTPEREAKKDPEKLLERVNAYMDKEEELQRARAVPAAYGDYPPGYPVTRCFIQRIKNGFLIGAEHMASGQDMEYFATEEEGIALFKKMLMKMSQPPPSPALPPGFGG